MKLRYRYLFCTIVIFLILGSFGSVFAADYPVKKYKLKNGLTVLMQKIPRSPAVSVSMLYKVGSRNEHMGINGISHLVEHIISKNSKKYPDGRAGSILSRVGATFNSVTSSDVTVFYQTLAPEYLELAFSIESDRMASSEFSEADLVNEKKAIINELSSFRSRPSYQLWKQVRASALVFHPYMLPVKGDEYDLMDLTLSQVVDFYKRNYQPSDAVLSIAGSFDEKTAVNLVSKYFDGIKNRNEKPVKISELPPTVTEKRIVMRNIGKVPLLHMAFRSPSIKEEDLFAMSVIDSLLTSGDTARLKGAFCADSINSVESWLDTTIDPGLYYLSFSLKSGADHKKVEQSVNAELDKLKTASVPDSELAVAKERLKAEFLKSKDSITSQARFLAWYEGIDSYRYLEDYTSKIEKVSSSDIINAARKYFDNTTVTVGEVHPKAASDEANPAFPDLDEKDSTDGISRAPVQIAKEFPAFNRANLKQTDEEPIISTSVNADQKDILIAAAAKKKPAAKKTPAKKKVKKTTKKTKKAAAKKSPKTAAAKKAAAKKAAAKKKAAQAKAKKSTKKPAVKKTAKPAAKPTPKPAAKPTPKPAVKPTPKPVSKPSPKPAVTPAAKPSPKLNPNLKVVPNISPEPVKSPDINELIKNQLTEPSPAVTPAPVEKIEVKEPNQGTAPVVEPVRIVKAKKKPSITKQITSKIQSLIKGSSAVEAKAVNLSFKRHVLPNGVVLLIHENHINQSVSVRGYVKAGGIYEPKEKAGIAKVTAYMLDSSAAELAKKSAANPLTCSADYSFNATSQFCEFGMWAPSEHFSDAVSTLGTIIAAPDLSDGKLAQVKAKMNQRLKTIDQDSSLICNREFFSAIFPDNHPFAHFRWGTEETINSITLDDVKNFYKNHYRPDSVIIAISGDITPDKAIEAFSASISSWKSDGEIPQIVLPAVNLPDKTERRTVTMSGKSRYDIILGHKGIPRNHPDYYKMTLLSRIIGGSQAQSRIAKNIRAKGLVYSYSCGLDPSIGDGPWKIRLEVDPKNIDRSISAVEDELKAIQKKPPTDEELDAARQSILGNIPVTLETNKNIAAMLLSIEYYRLGDDYLKNYPEIYKSITPEEIQEAAKKYLYPDKMMIIISGPAEKG